MSGAVMVLSEDGLMVLISRIETLAARADKMPALTVEAQTLRDRVARLGGALDEARRDVSAAEAKIAEWAEYASTLRSAINAIDPKAIKTKRIVLPDMPKPLETDIPF